MYSVWFSTTAGLLFTLRPHRPWHLSLPLIFSCHSPEEWGVKGQSFYGLGGLPLLALRDRVFALDLGMT